MAVSYGEAKRQILNCIGAYVGAPAATAQAIYISGLFTTTEIENPIFPPQAINDSLLGVQADMVRMIADTGNHPWRSLYISQTAGLLNGATIPSVDINGKQIVGIMGDIRDSSGTMDEFLMENQSLFELEDNGTLILEDSSTTGTPRGVLTSISLNRLRRLQRNIINHVASLDYYAIVDRAVYHFKGSVTIDVCVYDHAAELANITDPTKPVRVPETLVPALVLGTVAKLCLNEGSGLMGLAQGAASYYNNVMSQIAQGNTSIDPLAVPGPVAQR